MGEGNIILYNNHHLFMLPIKFLKKFLQSLNILYEIKIFMVIYDAYTELGYCMRRVHNIFLALLEFTQFSEKNLNTPKEKKT